MSIESFNFGMLGEVPVPGFVLRNTIGVTLKLVAYGARLTELHMPDARGHAVDVVLGFDTLAQYEASDAYMVLPADVMAAASAVERFRSAAGVFSSAEMRAITTPTAGISALTARSGRPRQTASPTGSISS